MKKILLVIFLFFIGSKVAAKTYYSDYGEFSEYNDIEILPSDTIYVEEIDKYQLYEENIVYEYLENSKFEYTGNTKLERTEWFEDYSFIDESKIIQMCYKYALKSVNEYNYLLIDNQSDFNLIIKNFKLLTLDNKVIMERNNIKLYDFSKYHVNLSEYGYKFDEIKLEVIYEKENIDQEGEISLGYYLNIKDDVTNLNNKIKESSINSNTLNDYITDFSIYSQYTNECYDYLPDTGIDYKTYYRNVIVLNEYKVIYKNYIDEYAIESRDGYLLDKEKIKKYYRYKKRDKVEISDLLIIDSYDVALDSFITYTTIPIENIKIISDIDYSKNGVYKVNYILPFKTITKDIKVNITDNYVNVINKQVEYINELKNNVELANYAVNKKNLEIKELIVEEENKVNSIIEELNTCYSDKTTLKNRQQSLKIESEEYNNKKIYITIIVGLILLLTILKKIIRKKYI